jgi:hypothetical protein
VTFKKTGSCLTFLSCSFCCSKAQMRASDEDTRSRKKSGTAENRTRGLSDANGARCHYATIPDAFKIGLLPRHSLSIRVRCVQSGPKEWLGQSRIKWETNLLLKKSILVCCRHIYAGTVFCPFTIFCSFMSKVA